MLIHNSQNISRVVWCWRAIKNLCELHQSDFKPRLVFSMPESGDENIRRSLCHRALKGIYILARKCARFNVIDMHAAMSAHL